MNRKLLEGGLKMKTIKQQIIQAFSEAGGEFLSGQTLADKIGCSRTAIWKHIAELKESGFELEAVRKKGYRMVKVAEQLTENQIQYQLKAKQFGKKVIHLDTVDSTQKTAYEEMVNRAEEGTVVIAEEQTASRGRMLRPWHSAYGKGIWMSIIVRPMLPPNKTPQFTLIMAIAVAKAIEEVTQLDVEIKWPNDLLINGKKCTGILTEMFAEANVVTALIIGVGINVNQESTEFPSELADKATSLKIQTNQEQSRIEIVQNILYYFEKYYALYMDKGFQPLKILWESYAKTIGKEIIAKTPHAEIKGTALCISEEGFLQVEDQAGHVHLIHSADIEI